MNPGEGKILGGGNSRISICIMLQVSTISLLRFAEVTATRVAVCVVPCQRHRWGIQRRRAGHCPYCTFWRQLRWQNQPLASLATYVQCRVFLTLPGTWYLVSGTWLGTWYWWCPDGWSPLLPAKSFWCKPKSDDGRTTNRWKWMDILYDHLAILPTWLPGTTNLTF
jgi:hypothetical protein